MMEIDELLRVHLKLECIGLNSDGLVIRIPGPYPDVIPRFYVAGHKNGFTTYVREDQPEQIRTRLSSLLPEEAFRDHKKVGEILAKVAPCEVLEGSSYGFPDTIALTDRSNAMQ
jgi:hypothetical protein